MTTHTTIRTAVLAAVCACSLVFANAAALPKDTSVTPQAQITNQTDSIINTILQAPLPVLVDFWAPWCGPCRMIKPIIAGIETKYKHKIIVLRFNVDDNQALSQTFGVTGIPAIYLIEHGKVIDNLVGMQQKENYELAVENALVKFAAEAKKDSTKQAKADSAQAAKPIPVPTTTGKQPGTH
jgi:thioredoxin 1